ncbi:MAG: DNA polymerase III subunit gamma/tau [Bacteroidia bacterium]|nr:DNA polymerase III subunit gamma/tau [Bacteroidia bacterium]
MENFIVSALKYRPADFDSVVGQKSITVTLKNAIKNNHLAHAYLFHGPRGVGKTTCARIFAKTINCNNLTENTEPCNACESCLSFNQSRSYNIHELDAASNNSVDDIRNLNDMVRIPPQIGKYSVYIIDEIHMLSTGAFNAFLKTLEEPPAHAIFILATTEKHKIIPTILSRCQIYNFNRIRISDISSYLDYVAKKEGVEADPEGLNIIAQKADGAMRDALSIFDQIVSFAGSKISYNDVISNLNVLDYDYYFRIAETILEGNYNNALLIFSEVLDKGFDGHHFLTGISKHLRDLLVSRDEATLELLDTGAQLRERYKLQAARFQSATLLAALEICYQADVTLKSSNDHRLHVELTLMQLCNIELKKKTGLIEHEKVVSESKPVQTYSRPASASRSVSPVARAEKTSDPVITRSTIPSIKDALKDSATSHSVKDVPPETTVAQENTEKNKTIPVVGNEIEMAWRKYADNVHQDKPILSEVIRSTKPEMTAVSTVTVNLTDNIQRMKLEEAMDDLQEFLRNELNNPDIVVNINISATAEEKVYFSNADKLNYFISKNPALLKLKQQFGLDFE